MTECLFGVSQLGNVACNVISSESLAIQGGDDQQLLSHTHAAAPVYSSQSRLYSHSGRLNQWSIWSRSFLSKPSYVWSGSDEANIAHGHVLPLLH